APHRKFPYYDDDACVRLLFVGRVIAHKCQDQLLTLVESLPRLMGCRTRLDLIGHFEHGEDYKRELDRRIKSPKLADRVTLHGRVSDAELYGWYRAADVYVSLSEHEGFGVPLIEAMALDLPVLAYAAGGVPS